MLIAIVGGGLQGVEVAYLSKKAGFRVMVVDKASDPPAKGLADIFVRMDVCQIKEVAKTLEKADLVLPALENDMVLKALDQWQKNSDTPLCFDLNAYKISSSKNKSNALFSKLEIPKPLEWPQCGFPVLVKPSKASGSHGVKIISSKDEWIKSFQALDPEDFPLNNPYPKKQLDELTEEKQWVAQEYISGPSYSLEIIGSPGRYQTLQVTELFMDENYDCKRVMAPARIEPKLSRDFETSAKTIAKELQLHGIMDFEVILHKGKMKLLEIDARFPSQTPMAVFASTGMNMVEILADLTLNQKTRSCFPLEKPNPPSEGFSPFYTGNTPKHAIIEHILVTPEGIRVKGENIMKSCGPLHLEKAFFGADEAVTSFVPKCSKWVATLIINGATRQENRDKKKRILEDLALKFNLPLLPDIDPYKL